MIDLTFNGKDLGFNGNNLAYYPELPPYTIRLRFADNVTPTFYKGTGVQVSSSPNVWDLTYVNNDWSSLLYNQEYLLEIMDTNIALVRDLHYLCQRCYSLQSVNIRRWAGTGVFYATFSQCSSLADVQFDNTGKVEIATRMFEGCSSLEYAPMIDTSLTTSMASMFNGCNSLKSVPLYDTSYAAQTSSMFAYCYALQSVPLFNTANVRDMDYMFLECSSLTAVPLLDTGSATTMNQMFYNCVNVQSGALALYIQAATQHMPPTYHDGTFYNCGVNTETGSEELSQIPSDWK